ncbi:hypothetical protein QB898_01530 [Ottowia sp. 10c7w1]|uniref:Uncharacterized protein n=1 Tax=Ottowia cancrivicina TaxID=3040346 RepID=A0AAW6RIS3_9BURK|nr:hypothetical protein [Ottowia sp. 10c7w1]
MLAHAAVKAQDVTAGIAHQVKFAPAKPLHLSQQDSLLFGAVVAGPQGGARRGRQRGSVNEFNDIEHTPLTALLHDPQPIAKRTAAQSTAVAAGAR